MQSPKPKFITVHRAAEMLSVSHQTIRRWIGADLLPARQFGGKGRRILIKIADLNQIMAEKEA